MLRLSHYLQVIAVVVVLIAVDVMDDLATLERSAQHLLGNHAVRVTAMKLAVGGGFDVVANALEMSFTGRSPPIGFRCDVVGVAVSPDALCVHAAHSATFGFGKLFTAFNTAWYGRLGSRPPPFRTQLLSEAPAGFCAVAKISLPELALRSAITEAGPKSVFGSTSLLQK